MRDNEITIMTDVEMKKIHDELLELRDVLENHIEYCTLLLEGHHSRNTAMIQYDNGKIDEAQDILEQLKPIINSIKKNSALKGCKITPHKTALRKPVRKTKRA